jgi:hypothetical protein
MDTVLWTLLIVVVTFYTLWAAGVFNKKKDDEKEKRGTD